MNSNKKSILTHHLLNSVLMITDVHNLHAMSIFRDDVLESVLLFSEFKFEGFNEDTCRSMVATMDVSLLRHNICDIWALHHDLR